jgi:RNA polymerase sigma factor (sigma-70 family)
MNYKTLNEVEKNQLVEQYEPLMNKLVAQFINDNVKCSWEDLKSYAYEGFALAIQKYDETRSSMNFTQYAAYYIRNNILLSLNNELRTVKLSAYAQKQVEKRGGSSFNMISIDSCGIDDETEHYRKIILSEIVEDKFSNGDVFEYLYTRLEEEFPYRECQMFYQTFGLKDFDVMKNKDIAKFHGVSEGLSCQKVSKIIKWIRKDNELCEQLSMLLTK